MTSAAREKSAISRTSLSSFGNSIAFSKPTCSIVVALIDWSAAERPRNVSTRAASLFDLDVAQNLVDRLLRQEFFVDARLLLALFVVAGDRPRLGGAGRHQLVAVGEGAFARGLEEPRILQRQEDDRVVLERHQLPEAGGIVVPLGPRMRPFPVLAQEPGDAPDPARERSDVAVEDRKLGGEREEANVERALDAACPSPGTRRESRSTRG